jgi:hypothetical protein
MRAAGMPELRRITGSIRSEPRGLIAVRRGRLRATLAPPKRRVFIWLSDAATRGCTIPRS